MNQHLQSPKWRHDCTKCIFLGQTIGGGRLTDLYVCDTFGPDKSPSLVARYGDQACDYYSIDANYAHPTGHAELLAASELWRRRGLLEDQ